MKAVHRLPPSPSAAAAAAAPVHASSRNRLDTHAQQFDKYRCTLGIQPPGTSPTTHRSMVSSMSSACAPGGACNFTAASAVTLTLCWCQPGPCRSSASSGMGAWDGEEEGRDAQREREKSLQLNMNETLLLMKNTKKTKANNYSGGSKMQKGACRWMGQAPHPTSLLCCLPTPSSNTHTHSPG